MKPRARMLLLCLLLAAPGLGVALFPCLPRTMAVLETHWRRNFAGRPIYGDSGAPLQSLIAIASELVARSER